MSHKSRYSLAMADLPVKEPSDADRTPVSRRQVLRAAAGLALARLGTRALAGGPASQPATAPASRPSSQPAGPAPGPVVPWWMRRFPRRARVIDIRSPRVVNESFVDDLVLGDMLDLGLRKLTDSKDPASAWRQILGDARRIVLKFNSVGANVLATNEVMANVLVGSLVAAGYGTDRIALIETPAYMPRRLRTRAPAGGWGPPIRLGRRLEKLEQLANYVYEADAIISVGLLKTHQIAGMSGCMKNLSHAVIRRPARYHDHGCAPYVPQVIASEPVSRRLRLNILNALRIIADRGPDARREDVAPYGGLLLSFDPLAIDEIGLSILAVERRRRKLPAAIRVPYLAAAAEMEIGHWRPGEVERVAVELET